MKRFKKILIANRGEIAVRVIRSAHELGIRTVAVYSKADATSLAVRHADEAYLLDGEALSDTYLNSRKIIAIAKQSACDAIHPGYGFLSENDEFAEACEQVGIAFIGPHPEAIRLMGNKVEARAFAEKHGIPLTKAVTGPVEELLEAAQEIPFPVLVKAAAGGGGKGMRIVEKPEELEETIRATSREALSYFGDSEVFVEQYIANPRHIEVQVLGDKHGQLIHLWERECSIQRRYQKIIEESPSPTLTQKVREAMAQTATEIAKAVSYTSAGTIEFLVDEKLNYYFLEMNTRIQVEHPVTEMVTGTDLVREQIRIAEGHPLSFKQEDIKQYGHAIEARIYAEDPMEDFRPSPGSITAYHEASGKGLRIDSAIDRPATIHSFYDPMISKVIAWGEDREQARERLLQALHSMQISGIDTNTEYLARLLDAKVFISNQVSTRFCDIESQMLKELVNSYRTAIKRNLLVAAYASFDMYLHKSKAQNIWQQMGYWRQLPALQYEIAEAFFTVQLVKQYGQSYQLLVEGQSYTCEIQNLSDEQLHIRINGQPEQFFISDNTEGHHQIQYNSSVFVIKRKGELLEQDTFSAFDDTSSGGNIQAPMPGKVIQVNVKEGDQVLKNDVLLIVEAMKMENNVLAGADGEVAEICTEAGEMVDPSKILIRMKEAE